MKLSDFAKSVFLFSAFTFFSQLLLAADESVQSVKSLSSKQIELPDGAGTVAINVRESKARFGLPFIIEAKAKCTNGKNSNSRETAVCDVKPESAKLSEDEKFIVLKIRETDSELYNQRSRTASAAELMKLEPSCKEEATELWLETKNFCN